MVGISEGTGLPTVIVHSSVVSSGATSVPRITASDDLHSYSGQNILSRSPVAGLFQCVEHAFDNVDDRVDSKQHLIH